MACARWLVGIGPRLFVVLLASFKLLLYRYTGQSDICVGVPVANRHRDETRGVIGLFVNTQVLRTQLDGRATIADVIGSVHSATIEAQENQDLPFERLLEILQPKRSLSQKSTLSGTLQSPTPAGVGQSAKT